jgi:hypothetical protein
VHGYVALREAESYRVIASYRSVPVGSLLEAPALTVPDLNAPVAVSAKQWDLLAPVCASDEQIGAIGLGPRATRVNYSDADLDLLMDVADWAGRLIAADARQRERRSHLLDLAQSVEKGEADLRSHTQTLATTLETQPNQEFVRQVELGLQHLADYADLGRSALVDQLNLPGGTHIERGKALRERLLAAVDSLKPAGSKPGDVPAREWHHYLILHDAYANDVPNRDIMGRLYISEGTFNRQRRRALQAVARVVYEGTGGQARA